MTIFYKRWAIYWWVREISHRVNYAVIERHTAQFPLNKPYIDWTTKKKKPYNEKSCLRPSPMVFYFLLFTLFWSKFYSNCASFLASKWSNKQYYGFKFEAILFIASFFKLNFLNYKLVFNFCLFLSFTEINYIWNIIPILKFWQFYSSN